MKPCTTRERLLEAAMDLIWAESYGSIGVDEICRKAKVQKGSFYHFFPSKTDLAAAALSEAWLKHRPYLELLFSEDIPPIQRLLHYFDFAVTKQKELKKKFGFFPGCPFTAIGMEQGGRQEVLRQTAEKHLDLVKQYFEVTLEEALRNGEIFIGCPAAKASEIFSLYLGAFARLRITNDIGVLGSVKAGALALLGFSAREISSELRRPIKKDVRRLVPV